MKLYWRRTRKIDGSLGENNIITIYKDPPQATNRDQISIPESWAKELGLPAVSPTDDRVYEIEIEIKVGRAFSKQWVEVTPKGSQCHNCKCTLDDGRIFCPFCGVRL